MGKAVGAIFFYLFMYSALQDRNDGAGGIDSPGTLLVFTLILFYVIPFGYRKMQTTIRERRYQAQERRARTSRENQEEYEHQTSLRRERERLEMQAEMRIKELIATIEVQHAADSRKMKQLASMKAEFANRQNTDMASLLGRLEAMKAGK